MKRIRMLFGLVIAMAFGGLAVVPAAQAQGAIFDRFEFVEEPYTFQEEICGIEVLIEGTATGAVRVRAGAGSRTSAFFEHRVSSFSETWTAANGSFVTVSGRGVFNEVKAVPLGDNVFRFTAIEAGQPFRLYDSQGNLLLRDSGVIAFSVILDTEGDATPGGILIAVLEPRLRGRHPGWDDETLCPVLVPLLTGP
jgi:hypothetical protein